MAAVATVAGALVLALAGSFSGLLIDEHGGVLGVVEWVLRTTVVLAAVVFVVAAAVLILRLRRRVRSPGLGWVVAGVCVVAFAWLVAIPVGYGVYLSHLPARDEVHDADLGAPKQAVALDGADEVRLHGWWVPSRNRAGVIALHGTGSSRLGVVQHARLLARHGYGVLALDLRGHGDSGGRSTSAPWKLGDDVDAVVRWMAARPDVDERRVGLLGVSMGGEVALRVAARRDDVGATVAEGVMGSGAGDASAAGASLPVVAQIGALAAVSAVLTGESPEADTELVERIAPGPLLLMSAGRSVEAELNRAFVRHTGPTTEH